MAGRFVVEAGEGEVILSGGFGVVGKVSGEETGGSYAVVEHPMEPGALAAPPHTHEDVDEVSFVVEGEIGVWMDGEEFRAGAGSYILKPRGVPHTFWNAGAERARVVEIISPAGFEKYFDELAGILASTPSGEPPGFGKISETAGRFGMTFHMEKMAEIMEKHGVELR
ncbi:MAG: cupin domain-containing protein [Actinomycetota bacterium]|jgi:mannose-6-phosphate isomerase-like protein (cupin superfamily)|nr:cupin domain-containing protein [Rubrobacter sp.]MDQ3509232.1 cupin domain-containing protein [Actinomycetota bacterium]